jgi:hypothetical protein
VLVLAKSKQMLVWEELWSVTQGPDLMGDAISRVMEAVASGLWPPPDQRGVTGRARAFAKGLVGGVDQVADDNRA